METPAFRPEGTLAEWLASRAHAVSARRLTADIVGGLLAAGVALAWRPRGWLALLAAGACFAAFGVWATAERRLAELPAIAWEEGSAGRERWWRAGRAAAAVVGTAAAVLLCFAVLFGVLGTWIS